MEGSSSSSLGVRKGAWCAFEDARLKACIQQYGEGKWHLVPQRAGLNRCRKSCRLRWLNYLRPNIKRGDFSEDEVDLMIRMHKLLGNRWSLIAGRLPGRTANDVKNYWNTNVRGKLESNKDKGGSVEQKPNEEKTTEPHEVIKPLPRTFSKACSPLQGNSASNIYELLDIDEHDHDHDHDHGDINDKQSYYTNQACADSLGSTDVCGRGLQVANDNACFLDEVDLIKDFLWDKELPTLTGTVGDFVLEDQSWSDFLHDMDVWDF